MGSAVHCPCDQGRSALIAAATQIATFKAKDEPGCKKRDVYYLSFLVSPSQIASMVIDQTVQILRRMAILRASAVDRPA